jgi:hypothetical protein
MLIQRRVIKSPYIKANAINTENIQTHVHGITLVDGKTKRKCTNFMFLQVNLPLISTWFVIK